MVKAVKRKRDVSGAGRKGKSFSNLFSGILTCKRCGAKLRYVDKGKPPKGGQYLLCSNAERNAGCKFYSWQYKEFETSLLTYVKELDFQSVIGNEEKTRLEKMRNLLAVKEQRLHEVSTVRENNADNFFDPELSINSKAAIKKRLLKLDGEESVLNSEKESILGKISEIENSLSGNVQSDALKMIELIQGLEGEELYDTRSRLSSIIKRAVAKIELEFSPKFIDPVVNVEDFDDLSQLINSIYIKDLKKRRYRTLESIQKFDPVN